MGDLNDATGEQAAQVSRVGDDRNAVRKEHGCNDSQDEGLDEHDPAEARAHGERAGVAEDDARCALDRALRGAEDGGGDG